MTGHRHVKVLIEKKALGDTILNTIRTHIADNTIMVGGLPVAITVDEYDPGKEPKDSRGYAMEPAQARGEIFLHDGAPWLPEFLREFRRFPGKPNDRVDALAQLVSKIAPAPGSKWRGFARASARLFGG
jgi:phage terminase large subunit-like protein